MPPPKTVARYRGDDGTRHDVVVLRTSAGRWRVLDRAGGHTVHVETLLGWDDRLSQATALAQDYAEQRQAFFAGERDDDPLPKRRPGPPSEPARAA